MRRVVVFDVETTGLRPFDRIVSLAAVRSVEGGAGYDLLHLCFDPRKDSDPGALAIHGWDDWTTRFQDLFADRAAELRAWFAEADLLIAHNIQFDLHYLNRELRKSGHPQLSTPTYCTMEAARDRWGSGRLDDCVARLGLRRESSGHHPVEDAFFAWNLFRHEHGFPMIPIPALGRPSNFRAALARPEGSLPRRAPKRPGGFASVADEGAERTLPALWSGQARDAVMEGARPLAVLLLSIANSDSRIQQHERTILAGVISREAMRIGLPPSPDDERRVLDDLCAIPPTANRITRATKAVLATEHAIAELPRLVAAMATVGGAVDASRKVALAALQAALRRQRDTSD